MEQLKVITPKWLIGWAALAVQIILSQLLLKFLQTNAMITHRDAKAQGDIK